MRSFPGNDGSGMGTVSFGGNAVQRAYCIHLSLRFFVDNSSDTFWAVRSALRDNTERPHAENHIGWRIRNDKRRDRAGVRVDDQIRI